MIGRWRGGRGPGTLLVALAPASGLSGNQRLWGSRRLGLGLLGDDHLKRRRGVEVGGEPEALSRERG